MRKTTRLRSVPDISFLVTANSKPEALAITLTSLNLQKKCSIEILVSNNATGQMREDITSICEMCDVTEVQNDEPECYSATNMLAKRARGKFLCFPSEEDYYTPIFGQKLLAHARRFKLDLVYCDCIYDSRYIGSYEVMRVQPIIGHIDKGGFLLKRQLFHGWPDTPTLPISSLCDGKLIENLRGDGISFGKIPEVLWVHN